MEKNKKYTIINCSNHDELLDAEFGKTGTPSRNEFDKETEAFSLAQSLKEEHYVSDWRL